MSNIYEEWMVLGLSRIQRQYRSGSELPFERFLEDLDGYIHRQWDPSIYGCPQSNPSAPVGKALALSLNLPVFEFNIPKNAACLFDLDEQTTYDTMGAYMANRAWRDAPRNSIQYEQRALCESIVNTACRLAAAVEDCSSYNIGTLMDKMGCEMELMSRLHREELRLRLNLVSMRPEILHMVQHGPQTESDSDTESSCSDVPPNSPIQSDDGLPNDSEESVYEFYCNDYPKTETLERPAIQQSNDLVHVRFASCSSAPRYWDTNFDSTVSARRFL